MKLLFGFILIVLKILLIKFFLFKIFIFILVLFFVKVSNFIVVVLVILGWFGIV